MISYGICVNAVTRINFSNLCSRQRQRAVS